MRLRLASVLLVRSTSIQPAPRDDNIRPSVRRATRDRRDEHASGLSELETRSLLWTRPIAPALTFVPTSELVPMA
ncbi:hypothetical protein DLJ53_02895 [Acuticoccus sediminis]|uniref:Uncharacterized protein n=1 Tax=Acuticoccus sediminis TaxID=2184697 RepID=A0A8B2P4F6_9HYPH|nr:hypothetical protein DLJ53_02895 [Acuticoccus sediminis]